MATAKCAAMERIVDSIAIRSVIALSMAWLVMLTVALGAEGDIGLTLKAPFLLFVGAAFASLLISCHCERRPAAAVSHLINCAALLIGAALIESVRLTLVLF
jgi:hypothetical protein